MADEEGFEPPIRVTPYKRFRVARIQPLCHSSVIPPFNIDNCDILQALFKNFYSFFDWLKSFFPAGASRLPTGIWLISFHEAGSFHSAATASSIRGL